MRSRPCATYNGQRATGWAARLRCMVRVARCMYRLAATAPALTVLLAGVAAAQDTTATPGLVPAGYGTLRQEDIAVRLTTGTFQLRVLPLDERVIRLLAPDSYTALHRLVASMAPRIAAAAQQAGLRAPMVFLVTFFGLQEQARFVAEDVTITSRNRFFRPIAVLPITPRWDEQQLRQRETASAVYVYEDGIALFEPFSVSYNGITSNDWEQALPTLDSERAAVLARAGRRP
jgi:hypothetical protein